MIGDRGMKRYRHTALSPLFVLSGRDSAIQSRSSTHASQGSLGYHLHPPAVPSSAMLHLITSLRPLVPVAVVSRFPVGLFTSGPWSVNRQQR